MKIPGTFREVEGEEMLWYIPDDGNPGRIFVTNKQRRAGCGYYGQTLTFCLTDGRHVDIVGPWNSNKLSLKHDTDIVL